MSLASLSVLYLQHAVQAAQVAQPDGVSVAVQQAPVAATAGLSAGAWAGIITFGITMAGVFLAIGASLADNRNLKKNTEDRVTGIERSVERELQNLKNTLASILEAQQEALTRQIEDAGWRAEIAALVREASTRAQQAFDTAHKARNMAQGYEPRIASLEEERERREEFERRTGLPDRRS